MKKLLLTLSATALTVGAFAQGAMNFGNATSLPGWPATVNRNVSFDGTAAQFNAGLLAGMNVGSNSAGANLSGLRATLYYAPTSVTDLSLFQQALFPAGVNTASFKQSTSASVGSWFNKNVTMAGDPNGQTDNFIVVVYDVNNPQAAVDPRQATAGTLWGASAIFTYTPPTSATPAPSEFLPINMGPMTIGVVPEPSTFALAGLGAAAMFIFRRRK